MLKSIFTSALLILHCAIAYSQDDYILDENVPYELVIKDRFPIVAAGKQYQVSSWNEIWWGKHYRKEWATPVQFPILKLATVDGGLHAIKTGGGFQTKSLRLLSANGKEYVLRRIDKNFEALLPDPLKRTTANDLLNDHISTAHPYGAIAVAKMAESIGILHTNPGIYFVPGSPSLGEFKNTFANKLCLLEERPSGKGWEGTKQFGYATDIVNSEKMFEKVFSSSMYNVDQQKYLTVRIFDMLINDVDRHEDQWIWASQKENGSTTFVPIARDRDQAFSRSDGILYFVARRAFRSLQNFDPHIKDVAGLNFSARHLDRQFLNELTKEHWLHSIGLIQENLTDSAIRAGIYSMPSEVNKISGEFLVKRLIQRRNNLDRDGSKYYSFLSKDVTVNGSADDEEFHIAFENANTVSVTGLRSATDTFYHRVCYRNQTKEINIYGLEGNDKFVLKGSHRNKFKIRLLGGTGYNSYSLIANGINGKNVFVYDSLQLSEKGHRDLKFAHQWDPLYNYSRKSVKYDWCGPVFIPGYNQDDGFHFGTGIVYNKQSWGKNPFGWQQRIIFNYLTRTSAIGFNYKGLFRQTFGQWDLDISSFYNGPRYTFNYYGFGNESKLNGYDRSYYQVKGNDFYLNLGIARSWKRSYMRAGLQYEAVKILKSENKFATSPESQLDSSVFSRMNFAGISGEWKYGNPAFRNQMRKGFELVFGMSYEHNLNITKNKILNLNSSIAIYLPVSKNLLFAHRTGGGTILGDYEFYQANTLGGDQNLRGYWRNRFTGKSNFYQNTELRWAFPSKVQYASGQVGLFSFFDNGRVWVRDETAPGFHIGYGGGIFFVSPGAAAFTIYYSHSKEVNMITARSSFFF